MQENRKTPLVSIIMPFYNADPYLEEAMDSILRQSFADYELIIINDGSTDASESILKNYNDERILYIKQVNAGVASSLNTGIELAKGKYIWRHDADDTCLPDKLEKQVHFLESHPEIALCATQIAFMTDSGKIAYSFRQPKKEYFNNSAYVIVEYAHFNPYSPITHATVLIRTAVMKEMKGYRTAFKTAEDVDLWLRIINGYKAAVLNQCNYFVRLYKTSATAKLGKRNEFYRNLALKLYQIRSKGEPDFIEKGEPVIYATCEEEEKFFDKGCKVRTDLLDFKYPLYLNAGDLRGAAKLAYEIIRDGWKKGITWKLLLFPILGTRLVKFLVRIKSIFR